MFCVFIFHFSMATQERKSPTPPLIEYPSDKEGPNIPAITVEEVLSKGDAPPPPAPDASKPVVDAPKKKKAATAAPGAVPKKKKSKKKPVPPPLQAPEGVRYYYDIQNLIVSNGTDLERFGIALPTQPITPSGSDAAIRSAPAPPKIKREQPTSPLVMDDPGAGEPEWAETFTQHGGFVTAGCMFCPECGLRVAKHGWNILKRDGGNIRILGCPVD